MSKPKYQWWGYVKSMIRRYPDECTKEERVAVEAAIEQTGRARDGADRLRLIEMVLIQKSHTLSGAATEVPCSERTAQRYHADFIKVVAKNFRCRGLL